jgi:hypothetical protein
MGAFRSWRSSIAVAGITVVMAVGCTDQDPARPHDPPATPRFSSHNGDLDFVFRRLELTAAPAVAGGHGGLQAVAPLASGHVVVTRADDRFLSVAVGATAVVDGAFTDAAPATPAQNFGAWADGAGGAWLANDKGQLVRYNSGVWSTVTHACGNCQTLAVWGTGPNAVWAAGGDRGSTGNAYIRRFNGVEWSNESVPGNAGGIWGLWGTNRAQWAVGAAGTILRASPAGKWDRVTAPSGVGTATLRDVHGTSANNVWAVGDGGLVLRFNGTSWSVAATLPAAGDLYAVQVFSPTRVYVAGNGLYRFDGTSWTQVIDSALDGLVFNDLRFVNGALFGATAQGALVVGKPFHTVTVETGVAGATVTWVDVKTGNWDVACTDANGRHSFVVEAGAYAFHARNLRICSKEDLTIWPEQTEGKILPTGPAGENRSGVIWYEPEQMAVPLTPASYRAAVKTPLVLNGGATTLPLPFGAGLEISCVLLDEQGLPLSVLETEQVFYMAPLGPDEGLPPIANPLGFPRALGLLVLTIPKGSSEGCVGRGLPADVQYMLETNQVQVGSEMRTYRGAATLNAPRFMPLGPEPLRLRTDYLYDPCGDSQANWDICEMVAFGWSVPPHSDDFIVAAEWLSYMPNGNGNYVLDLRWFDGGTLRELSIRANCTVTSSGSSCSESGGTTPGATVSGTGYFVAPGVAEGKVVWQVTLPGVTTLQFRVRVHSQGQTADSVPDDGWAEAEKPEGPGSNTFIIPG